jgi:5-formyltetrahydrofolate cyclo-ligase
LSPAERAAKSAAIAERLLALPELRSAGTVMLFVSFGSEVDTAPILDLLATEGRKIVLPRVQEGEVVPVPWDPGQTLAPAPFGAGEPPGDPVDPGEIDVVVTPGLAFDRRGNRTGYGGGYYDRLFRRMRPDVPKVAVAFSLQIVDAVPTGRGDRRVHVVVTEDEVIRRPG